MFNAKRIKIVVLALCALAALVWLSLPGEVPYQIVISGDVSIQTNNKDLMVHGKYICKRKFEVASDGINWFPLFDDSLGEYDCTVPWFYKEIEDGSALVVGVPYSNLGDTGWSYPGPCAALPSVLWVDNGANPDRGEFYFSEVSLEHPESRLNKISCHVTDVERNSFFVHWIQQYANRITARLFGINMFNDSSKIEISSSWFLSNFVLKSSSLTAYYGVLSPRNIWPPDLLPLETALEDGGDVLPTLGMALSQSEINSLREMGAGLEISVSPRMANGPEGLHTLGTFDPSPRFDPAINHIVPFYMDEQGNLVPWVDRIPGVLIFIRSREDGPYKHTIKLNESYPWFEAGSLGNTIAINDDMFPGDIMTIYAVRFR